MRDKQDHKWRMAERRERQLDRTANCSPFGRKLVSAEVVMPDGTVRRHKVGVERLDEQGMYRAEHWNKEPTDAAQ